jgi:hypothetical protein
VVTFFVVEPAHRGLNSKVGISARIYLNLHDLSVNSETFVMILSFLRSAKGGHTSRMCLCAFIDARVYERGYHH